jgi:periodic tryptophan protein 1
VRWNPKEDGVLISAGFDKQVVLHNVQQTKIQKIAIKNEVESMCWEPSECRQFAVSDEGGIVDIYDARYMNEDTKISSFKAHDAAVTNVVYSLHKAKQLVTSSTDGSLKHWDVSTAEPKLISEKKCDIGEVFGISVCPDIEDTVAAGGSKGEMFIWEIE